MKRIFSSLNKWELFLPLFLFFLGTLVCFFTDLDLLISGFFYNPETQTWDWKDYFLFDFGNKYGPALCGLVLLWAVVRWILSLISPEKLFYRGTSYFIILCFLVGPLLMVNGVMKNSWKRPRPREVVQFNGNHEFKKVLVFGDREFEGKSFPSGHGSAGFVLVCLYFLGKRKSKTSSFALLLFSFVMGGWLALTRIASGGHFFSDNLWSLGICWFIAYFLYYLWYLPYEKKPKKVFQPSRKRTGLSLLFLFMCLILMIAPFLVATPMEENFKPKDVFLSSEIERVIIKGRVRIGDIHAFRTENKEKLRIYTWGRGFGFPGLTIDKKLQFRREEKTLYIDYRVKPEGLWSEYQSHNDFIVPLRVEVEWDLKTEQGSVFHHEKLR